MPNETKRPQSRNQANPKASPDIRLTAKSYAEQHGISGRDVVDVVSQFGIEAQRDENGVVTYALDDLNYFMAKSVTEIRQRQRENELEFFRRLLPEIKASIVESVREVCKQELTLAVAIRDTKESMLVELLGAQRAQVREIRATISFLTRLVSQVNLATVAGVFSGLPTSGVSGSSESLGVDAPLPHGIEFRPQSQNNSKMAANQQKKPKNESASSSNARSKDAGNISKKAQNNHNRSDHSPGESDIQLKNHVNSDSSPLLQAMLPQLTTLDQSCAAPIVQHQLLIEEMLQMSDLDLTRIDSDEKAAIEDILAPWSELVADLPRFTTFFGSFSIIQSWIAEKRSDMPLLIAFLALNRQVPGCVSAADLVDMCGMIHG